jgi:hypothetical protein
VRSDRQASIIDCSTNSGRSSRYEQGSSRGRLGGFGTGSRRRGATRAACSGCLALVLSSVQAHAAAAPERLADPAASPSAESDVEADVLRVEVAPEIDDAALLPAWVADRHPGLSRALRSPDGTPAQSISVRITGSTYDYRVAVVAMRGGEALRTSREPTRCECTTEELLELVDAGIEAASEQLRVHAQREPVPKVEAEAEASEAKPGPEPEPRGPSLGQSTIDAPSRRLGSLGRTGIGVGVAGAGLTTAGILLAMRPKEVRGEPGRVETRSFRDSGIGLATSGGVVLATGVALLVVDLVTARKRSIALVPLLRPRMAGVSFVRRF